MQWISFSGVYDNGQNLSANVKKSYIYCTTILFSDQMHCLPTRMAQLVIWALVNLQTC